MINVRVTCMETSCAQGCRCSSGYQSKSKTKSRLEMVDVGIFVFAVQSAFSRVERGLKTRDVLKEGGGGNEERQKEKRVQGEKETDLRG